MRSKLKSALGTLLMLVFFTILTPLAEAQASYSGTVDFGTVAVGTSSGTQTLTFSFSSPTALNVTTPVQVLTTGISGLDFKSDGSGTCGGSTYSTCTVGVTFSPGNPGLRQGAVVLEDISGNVLVTAFVHGIGQGPQVTFNTGTKTTVGANFGGPGASAVDAAGNVYVADTGDEAIWKIAPGGIQSRIAPMNLPAAPVGIAVDGAGNLYIACSGQTGAILKETPSGVMTTIGSGFTGLDNLATDGLGNLYVANPILNVVTVFTPAGTQSNIGTGLFNPSGVAVDAAGNVYISDSQNFRIVKVAPDGTQTVLVSGSPLFPEAIAVDAAGNIYVADAGTNTAIEYSPTGAVIRTLATGLNFPVGITVDSFGSVYIAQGATLVKLDRSTPPTVGFITGTVGTTTSDSPRSVAVENDGNAALSFTVPASGATNPAIAPADFSLDNTTTCPNLMPSSATGTLASGASCIYAIDYKPSTTTSVTGSLVLADNSLNVANAKQSIMLNNQGVPVIIQATVNVPPFTMATATGAPFVVAVTTVPAGLNVTVTYQSLTTGAPATTTPPSLPDFYMVTAVVNQTGYAGSGSGYLILSSPAPATITWANPANIAVGTPLSATQLNATANTPGTFTYSPAAGTLLAVGTYPLAVTFVPTDTTDFVSSTATVTLVVVPQNTQAVTPVNFNTVNVGTTSGTQTVTFTFTNPVTLGSNPVAVLTQGVAGLDFKNTNAGNCAAGSYAATNLCTVTVNFTPGAPGPRLGSVELLDGSGNVVATAFIGGVGQGPQIVYDPGVKSTFAPNIATEGLAIDAAGDVYLNNLSSIVKVTPGGMQTTVASGPSSAPLGVSGSTAVDGAGNIYTLNTANSAVYEITPSGAQYQVGSGWVFATDLTVDAAGNLYVLDRGYNPPPDTTGGRLTKISAAGIQTTMAGPFVSPEGVAVDSAGNAYVTDNAGLGIINPGLIGVLYKVTPTGTLSTVASGLFSPNYVAVDAAGNLFVTGASTHSSIDKITPAGVRTTLYEGQVSFPGEVKISPSGDLYITQAVSGAQLLKFDRSTVPSLTFESTTVNTTSADSPQTVTVENIGNAVLNFPVPGSGTNASITANFSLTPATTCPDSGAASMLAIGTSCVYAVSFLPTTTGPIPGTLTLTDNNLNATNAMQNIVLNGTGASVVTVPATVMLTGLTQTYTGSPLPVTATTNPPGLTVSITYNGSPAPPTAAGNYTVVATVTSSGYSGSSTQTMVISQVMPVVTWATPAAINYGTALSATQLNATASVSGTFAYTPAAGTVPVAGTVALSVLFTPSDTVDYTTATKTVSLVVNPATPVVAWATPAAITYGTMLSATQLNATSPVVGTFSYTPAAGTTPLAGTDTLSVLFTPNDTADYTIANRTVNLVVNPATPVITWPTPAAISYGMALSGTQLNATASVAGTFVYTPAAGNTPAAGTDTLSVTFTPTDSTDYMTVTQTVNLVVNQETPVVTWPTPASIGFGTALSGTQLDATASVAGTFVYTPAAGSIPAAGTNMLSVKFTPTDSTDYATVTQTVNLVVNQATPVVTWPTPAAITYGTALSGTQLNATASVPGMFVYTPAAGNIPTVGTVTVSVRFTPTDATDYIAVTKTVSLVVNQATPVVTWPTPASIVFGTALSGTQLNATASVPGTFTYTPSAGTTPAVGADILSVLFTPSDSVNYTTATQTVNLVVTRPVPVVTWPTPTAITYGTPLSATQLDATASVPGSFSYTPAAGAILPAGTDTLSVTFTPTDTTTYSTATQTVSLVVNQAAPVVNWTTPASIVYGTALSTTQLDATASVPGSFTYTPAAGSTPGTGTDTLSVVFTPTDTVDYSKMTKTVSLIVTQATPVITWANPASISYGTALNSTQLNATASVAGTFTYTPAAGTIPTVGADTLSVLFTPTDTTDYTTASKTVSIVVTAPAPVIAWTSPAAITYGTALSAAQLDATASVPGTFTYTPALGVVLPAGTDSLSVLFTPTDMVDYTTATKMVSLVVNQATPVITWTTPAAIAFGTALSATQLDATASLPGTFVYTPAAGAMPAVGADTLSVLFTPTDAVDYMPVTKTVSLTVTAAPDFTFAASGGQSQTIVPPGSATYLFAVAPTQGTYPGAVTFGVSGLPSGYTGTFTPASIAVGGGSQTVTLVVQAPLAAKLLARPGRYLPMGAGLLLLPLMGLGRLRRFRQQAGRFSLLFLMALTGMAALAGVTGCGTGNGFFEQSGTVYTITVTATSGALQHSTTVQLEVK